MYEIEISDKNYTKWNIISSIDSDSDSDFDFQNKNPFSCKLFHKDQFQHTNNNDLIITNSPTRNMKFLAGILILENNRTFGRTPNKKKLYYSCIPYQKQLPIFLIPYEIQLGFHKNIKNKFVLFKFDYWNDNDKHPYGILTETIGDVDQLPYYYEYQLYAKNIHPCSIHSIISKNNKKIKTLLQNKKLDLYFQEILNNPQEYGNIQKKEAANINIFSIDPIGCVDRDDALSICKTDIPTIYTVRVYIANIWVWIKAFDLWELFEKTNVSTIYLPDFNRHMLPTELSENICSLNIGHPCFAFCMEFRVDIFNKIIEPIYNPDILSQKCIVVSKNFDYESKSLLKYSPYLLLLQITRELSSDIKDSHELVAFWMMKMNTCIAKEMYLKKIGIFRITNSNPNHNNPPINTIGKKDEFASFLYLWEHAISGEYVEYTNENSSYSHSLLNVEHYMHFTSPIRRKVDIYNQLVWITSITSSQVNLQNIHHIEKINKDTKIIRKIQNECSLLHLLQNATNENIITDGIIIQIINETKSLIYLPTYKCILSSIIICDIYTKIKCKIYIFEREHDYKKKIKISII